MRAIINYSYRFKLRPTRIQERWFRQVGGMTRFIYNYYLALDQIKVRSVNEKCNDLTDLKRRLPWLRNAPSQVLQQKIKDLHDGWNRFFSGQNRRPSFKRKSEVNDSFRFPQGFRIDNGRVFLPKLGWVKFRKSRDVEGVARSITVKQETDGWYISVLTRKRIEIKGQESDPIGVDLGIKTFVTLSDGTEFRSVKPLKKYLRKLAREQQRLSRKKVGSHNRTKQRRKVAKVYKRITNLRNDYLHKVSTSIAKSHSLVCVEDLNVSDLVKNRRWARAISDQGWSKFISMLEYKTSWYGSKLVKVDRWFASSKLCSGCGSKKSDLTLADRTYKCLQCGLLINRDLNAAINIVRKGTGGQSGTPSRELEEACGDHVRPNVRLRSRKQEPIRDNRSLWLLPRNSQIIGMGRMPKNRCSAN